MYTVHKDFHPWHEVDEKKLDEVLYGRMLDLSGLDRPLVIKKIEYLYNNGFYLVRTTTEDGHVGVAVPTKRIDLAESLLYRCVAPYFIGKDARDIEDLVDGVYVWKSNYKLAGLPFFIAHSAIETSILDLPSSLATCEAGLVCLQPSVVLSGAGIVSHGASLRASACQHRRMDVCFLEAVPGTGFPGAPCLASHHCRACFAGGKAPAGSPVSDAAGCAGCVPAEAQWTSIGLPCRLPCPDRFRCMSGHGCLAGVLHLDPVRHASLGHALSGHTPPVLHRQHRLARFACSLPAHMARLRALWAR